MSDISRRRFVVGATTAASVLGLNGAVEFIPSAFAQAAADRQNPKALTHYRFNLGDIEITQVFDGESLIPHNPGFIRNASVDDTKAALRAANMADDMLPLCYTVTIAKIGGKYVMFDSGNNQGGQPKTGRLVANMKAAGIEPKDISTIVVTHFHGDHIFGLYGKENDQAWPHADIVMPAAEYDFWTDASKTAKLPENRQGLAKRIQATFPNWKNIRRFSGEADVVAGVKPVPTYGHSAGHTSFIIGSGANTYLVVADVTNITQLFVRNPGWHAAFDQDPQQAEATRRKLFDRLVADKQLCGGYHWGMPGCGTLAKDGAGYVFNPRA